MFVWENKIYTHNLLEKSLIQRQEYFFIELINVRFSHYQSRLKTLLKSLQYENHRNK